MMANGPDGRVTSDSHSRTTDMKKTLSSLKEAQDKAKGMRLTREEAAKCIRETPRGRFAFYDKARGEPVRPMITEHQTYDH